MPHVSAACTSTHSQSKSTQVQALLLTPPPHLGGRDALLLVLFHHPLQVSRRGRADELQLAHAINLNLRIQRQQRRRARTHGRAGVRSQLHPGAAAYAHRQPHHGHCGGSSLYGWPIERPDSATARGTGARSAGEAVPASVAHAPQCWQPSTGPAN